VEILAQSSTAFVLTVHTIFRALIYWAHRAVVLAIAWHLVWLWDTLFPSRGYANSLFRFSCEWQHS